MLSSWYFVPSYLLQIDIQRGQRLRQSVHLGSERAQVSERVMTALRIRRTGHPMDELVSPVHSKLSKFLQRLL